MFCDAYILLMATFVLWIPSKKFVQTLSANLSDSSRCLATMHWKVFENQFAMLRQLSRLVNRAFGNVVVWFVLECLLYYCCEADEIIGQFQHENTDWKRVVFTSLYMLQFHFILLLSADIPSKVINRATFFRFDLHKALCNRFCWLQMSVVKEWLEIPENVNSIFPNKLSLILDNLNSNDVAVKGSNYFSISYPFLGSVSVNAHLLKPHLSTSGSRLSSSNILQMIFQSKYLIF